MKISYDGYLTEQKLGVILKNLIKSSDLQLVPQYKLGRLKCDYAILRNEKVVVVYEFDGFQHYNSYKVQDRDRRKDTLLKELGAKVIRIPYYIQLRADVLQFYLPTKKPHKSVVEYPHGFIDPRALHPLDFNEAGQQLFAQHLQTMPRSAALEIWYSMLTSTDMSAEQIAWWPAFIYERIYKRKINKPIINIRQEQSRVS